MIPGDLEIPCLALDSGSEIDSLLLPWLPNPSLRVLAKVALEGSEGEAGQ